MQIIPIHELVNDFKQLQQAHQQYQSLMGTHYGALMDCAKKIQEAVKFVYQQEFSSNKYSSIIDSRWFTHSDWVTIQEVYDILSFEFWEEGRCGNSDESLHAFPIEESFFTENGISDFVNQWRDQQLMKISRKTEEDNIARQKKIQSLEEQLAKLKAE